MQEMYELKFELIRGCRAIFINNWNISLLYRLGVSWRAVNLHSGIKRFDEEISRDPFHEGTSNNHSPEDNEMLGMLHDLQASFEHEEETEEGLENDMSVNSGVEQETINIFEELLNDTTKNREFLDVEKLVRKHDVGRSQCFPTQLGARRGKVFLPTQTH